MLFTTEPFLQAFLLMLLLLLLFPCIARKIEDKGREMESGQS